MNAQDRPSGYKGCTGPIGKQDVQGPTGPSIYISKAIAYVYPSCYIQCSPRTDITISFDSNDNVLCDGITLSDDHTKIMIDGLNFPGLYTFNYTIQLETQASSLKKSYLILSDTDTYLGVTSGCDQSLSSSSQKIITNFCTLQLILNNESYEGSLSSTTQLSIQRLQVM